MGRNHEDNGFWFYKLILMQEFYQMQSNSYQSKLSIVEGDFVHANLLRDLGEQTFRQAYATDTDATNMDLYVNENFKLKHIESELNNPYSKYLLIKSDEEWVGYALLRWDKSHELLENARALKLHRIYMLQKFWGRHLGTAFLEYILDFAKKEKYEWLWLVVWSENQRAMRFYEKWGFEHFGYESFQFGEEVTNDWALRKKLQ